MPIFGKKKKSLPTVVLETPDNQGTTSFAPKAELTNRGQPGVAGFYQQAESTEAAQQLIKQDKPGTCLAESLVVTYLPKGEVSRNAVNRAHVGVGHTVDDSNGESEAMVFSVQDRIAPKAKGEVFKKFDLLVLGHDRDPKTRSSQESQNSERIKQFLATEMSTSAKLQLAQAIYISQVNGDESLHLGQFVCSAKKETDARGQEKFVITDIKRIDFGALGRFAMFRSDHRPLHTSFQYQHTRLGQSGKDYVSYLLQDPVVKNEVMRLWSKTDPEEVVRQVGERFDSQVGALHDPKLKSKALQEFNRELGAPSTQPADQGTVKANLMYATKRRCTGMMEAAVHQHHQQDLQVIEAYETYVKHELERDPEDAGMLEMQQLLTKTQQLSPQERLQRVEEAQDRLLHQESAKRNVAQPAPQQEALPAQKVPEGQAEPLEQESASSNLSQPAPSSEELSGKFSAFKQKHGETTCTAPAKPETSAEGEYQEDGAGASKSSL